MTSLKLLKEKAPLVICITNDVVKNFTANGLVALGASPAMSEYPEDLEDLLKYASKFRGIALDVFEQEPLNQSSELWNLENIIITPHNSWVSDQNHERSFNLFYNNLKRYISGKNPENIVEIEKGY